MRSFMAPPFRSRELQIAGHLWSTPIRGHLRAEVCKQVAHVPSASTRSLLERARPLAGGPVHALARPLIDVGQRLVVIDVVDRLRGHLAAAARHPAAHRHGRHRRRDLGRELPEDRRHRDRVTIAFYTPAALDLADDLVPDLLDRLPPLRRAYPM